MALEAPTPGISGAQRSRYEQGSMEIRRRYHPPRCPGAPEQRHCSGATLRTLVQLWVCFPDIVASRVACSLTTMRTRSGCCTDIRVSHRMESTGFISGCLPTCGACVHDCRTQLPPVTTLPACQEKREGTDLPGTAREAQETIQSVLSHSVGLVVRLACQYG